MGKAELFDLSETEDSAAMEDLLEKMDEISPNARDNAAHALLYGFSEHGFADPPLAAIQRFLQRVLSAAKKSENAVSEEGRLLAEQARTDRLDPDTEHVQMAASKVVREFDRLRGLLRFNPETMENGKNFLCGKNCRYTARCAPDHFVLPLLADHFWRRFGVESWAIIDEKRNIGLFSENGKEPALLRLDSKENFGNNAVKQNSDKWEALWKNYHRSINNGERANPHLQKQFMPRRYWKYLTEME